MKVVGEDAIEAMRHAARAAAITAATLLTTVVAVADAAERGYDADEVAFALTWTQGQARSQVEFGRYLIRTLPTVFAALQTGAIDSRRAWTFYDVLATVDDTIASTIAAKLGPDSGEWTTTQLRDRLRRAVLKADPGGAKDRTERSLADRRIGTTPDTDGTASLFGVQLPAARVCAAFERVDAIAHGIKQTGDGRTMEQLRADTFLDLLEGVGIGAHPVHRAGVIELTIPWETAIGAADEPATLAGYGPVSADIARQILASQTAVASQWMFSTYGPGGDLLANGLLSSRPTTPADPADAAPDAASTSRSASTGLVGSSTGRVASSNSGGVNRLSAPGTASDPGKRPPATTPPSAGLSAATGASATPRPVRPVPIPPVETDPTRRTPGAALTRWIRTRDRTCRAPGCTRRARNADIDHTIAHADGGLTTHENLEVLCRYHHRLKHEAGWTVKQPRPGHIEWTSPTGHTYHTAPDPP